MISARTAGLFAGTAACLVSIVLCAVPVAPAAAQPNAGTGTFSDIVTTGPWVDVRAFGADPTGVSDSAAAFEAAIRFAVKPTAPPGSWDATRYSRRIYVPLGHYKWSRGIVIPESLNVEVFGDGSGFGYSTTIQYSGADNTTGYLLDARSVLGLKLSNLTFIGQSDTNDPGSPCMQNGIITGRMGAGHFFNSANDWKNVSVIRFPGVGITFGRYAGWRGSYGIDAGQTDNSRFTDLSVQDCRIGIVINSPNFLQCFFDRLTVFSYGGNPVDGRNNPIEAAGAAPIKFRTMNAVRLLYGNFAGSSIHLYAPFHDNTERHPESQYALYVVDGSFNILSGYTENHSFAYVVNGIDNNGGFFAKPPNTIMNFHLNPGAAGGPYIATKYPVYYDYRNAALVLVGTQDLTVREGPNSAGVVALGARVQTPYVATTNPAEFARSPRSYEIGCLYMASSGGTPHWATGMRIGQYMLSGMDNGLILAAGLSPRATGSPDGPVYQFDAPPGNVSRGIIFDDDGVTYYKTNLLPKTTYSKSQLKTFGTRFRIADNGAVVITSPAAPKTRTDPCTAGERRFDDDYLYWCYADNNWRRTAHDASW